MFVKSLVNKIVQQPVAALIMTDQQWNILGAEASHNVWWREKLKVISFKKAFRGIEIQLLKLS